MGGAALGGAALRVLVVEGVIVVVITNMHMMYRMSKSSKWNKGLRSTSHFLHCAIHLPTLQVEQFLVKKWCVLIYRSHFSSKPM